MKKLSKPQPKLQKPAYVWDEVVVWILFKYKKDITNWTDKWSPGNNHLPFQSFWHTILNISNPQEDSYFYLSLNKKDYLEDFEKEIISILKKEFPEAKSGMRIYLE